MGIRSTIASFAMQGAIRDAVEQALANRSFVTPAELQTVKQDLAKVANVSGGGDAGLGERLSSLDKRIAALEKKQSMTMGAVQAGTAQIMEVKAKAEEAASGAAKATAAANSATATAESVSDGISALEERLDALGAGKAQTAKPKASKKAAKTSKPKADNAADKGCKHAGCKGKHRARGFCGKHYQMWKRGTLGGYVDGDGQVIDDQGTARYKVAKKLAGEPAKIAGGQVLIGGARVDAKAV